MVGKDVDKIVKYLVALVIVIISIVVCLRFREVREVSLPYGVTVKFPESSQEKPNEGIERVPRRTKISEQELYELKSSLLNLTAEYYPEYSQKTFDTMSDKEVIIRVRDNIIIAIADISGDSEVKDHIIAQWHTKYNSHRCNVCRNMANRIAKGTKLEL